MWIESNRYLGVRKQKYLDFLRYHFCATVCCDYSET